MADDPGPAGGALPPPGAAPSPEGAPVARMSVRLAVVLVLLAAVGFGLLPLMSRIAYSGGLGPEAALAYRFALPAVLFAGFLPRLARRPRDAAAAFATGLFLGLGVLGYFRSIAEMPVATAALIYFTFPLFVVAIGFLAFGLRPDWRALAGAVLVIGACALILDPATLAARPLAVLHAFLAPASYATAILVISHVLGSADRLSTMAWIYVGTGGVSLGSALIATPAAALVPATLPALAGAVGLVTVAGILPQMAFVFGAPNVGPARTSVLGTFELVVSLACGWFLLAEPAQGREIAGAFLIVAAIALAAAPAMAVGASRA